MKYCKMRFKIVDQILLDKYGICNASTKKSKQGIDWGKRELDFINISKRVKSKRKCMIALSRKWR